MAEIVAAIVQAVGAARTFSWAWSELTKGRPSRQLKHEAHETTASWKVALRRVPQLMDKELWALEKSCDIAKRSVILILQYSSVFATKSEERSRIMLISNVVDPEIKYRKNADSSSEYGKYLLKETLVDLSALVFISKYVGTHAWSPRYGWVVHPSPSAHVMEMIIMRAHRHCVMLLEAIRLEIMERTDNFMSQPVALYRFKKSFLSESTSHVEVTTNVSSTGESTAAVIVDPSTSASTLSPQTTSVTKLLKAVSEPGQYCTGLEPNQDELDRIRRGVSFYQAMKTTHMEKAADWVTYMKAFVVRDLEVAGKVNPRVEILRKAAKTYLKVANVVQAEGGLKDNLLWYGKKTCELLMQVIGLTIAQLELQAAKD